MNEQYTWENVSPTIIIGHDGDDWVSNTITITSNSSNYPAGTKMSVSWAPRCPVEEMKDLVSKMTEAFMEKYR